MCWLKDVVKRYTIVIHANDDEGRENMHGTIKNPCKYGRELENTCKPPQIHHKMGHSCARDKIISMLLHKYGDTETCTLLPLESKCRYTILLTVNVSLRQ